MRYSTIFASFETEHGWEMCVKVKRDRNRGKEKEKLGPRGL